MMKSLKRNLKRAFPRTASVYRRWHLEARRRLFGARDSSVFRTIFGRNIWRDPDSRSGTGSNLEQTAIIRREVPALLERLGIETMLDAPCGDRFWIRMIDLPVDHYIGVDVVPEVIEACRHQDAADGRRFEVIDLISDELPKVDLILSRDCLVHLSLKDALRALRNLKRSESTWLLTTTFTDRRTNIDIATGDWRPLNLQRPPFSFPPPAHLINEGCTEHDGEFRDKSLGLWRLEDIAIET